eukprot:12653838-Prorocentrum_lima.AAC.1
MGAVDPGTLMKMSSADGEQWVYAIRAELSSVDDLEVVDQVIREYITAMKRNGIYPKRLPA